jgi:multiple sugar transport system ATP-binding protein
MRMIAGLKEISHGEIFLDERRLNDVPPNERDVAFLSHGYTPYPRMPVYENIALGLRRRKFAETEIKKRILSVAEVLGLDKELEARSHSLSDEKRQLTGLACAMARQPKVYLFDEPFAGFQASTQPRGRAEIRKLYQRASATIIYATHDPMEAMALGERTLVLDGGVVQQDGDARTLFDEPANLFVASFFGEPPMNLVHGTLKQERDSLLFSEAGDGTIAISLPISRFPGAKELSSKPIVLGVRPEDIEIASSPDGADLAATRFRATVERAEPRGTQTDLYVQTGTHELICRSRHWVDQREGGHRFQFQIQLEKVHLFDPVSGRRITPEP